MLSGAGGGGASSSSLESVIKWSADQVRDELARVGLSTAGLESDLRARLMRAHTNALLASDWPEERVTTVARQVQNRFAQAQQEQQLKLQRNLQEGVGEVLREFTASFLPDETAVRTKSGVSVRMKTFVRADTAAAYVPDAVEHTTAAAVAPPTVDVPASAKKRRMMDELKEEFSRRHPQQQSQQQPTQPQQQQQQQQDTYREDASAVPLPTNIFLGAVHPDMQEEALFRLFSVFGAVESVKVMWPPASETTPRTRHTAFVSMMRRDDAEAAFDALQGKLVGDRVFRLDWTQSPAATEPLRLEDLMLRKRLKVPRPMHVFVMPPADARLHQIVDEMAALVAERGPAFERHVFESEARNPACAWMFDADSPVFDYYRWRVYAFVHGDSAVQWNVAPFVLANDGVLWFPPPLLEPRYARGTRVAVALRSDELTSAERGELAGLIAALTPERGSIGMTMLFALNHAEKAGDVVRVIVEHLTSARTPPAAKIVALFVVSDILHNTSNTDVPKAAHYRNEFEPRLPAVMQCLNETLNGTTSRISSQHIRDRVLRLLRIWQSWSLFSDIFITGLQTTFLAAPPRVDGVVDELDGEPISAAELPSEFDALDDRQLRIKCRAMGVPDGSRVEMLSRLKIANLVAESAGVTIGSSS
jgi:hypothetical protein